MAVEAFVEEEPDTERVEQAHRRPGARRRDPVGDEVETDPRDRDIDHRLRPDDFVLRFPLGECERSQHEHQALLDPEAYISRLIQSELGAAPAQDPK